MIFDFNVSNHNLTLVAPSSLYSGNSNYYTCRFNFMSDDWSQLTKFAVFTNDSKAFSVPLENNQCIIPYDVLIENSPIFAGVYGTNHSEENYTRISTGLVCIFVADGAYKEASVPPVPTPDLWEKYYEEVVRVGGFVDRAENASSEAGLYADSAKESENTAAQALSDLLAMLGTDIATLINGKIPVSQIPSIATTEIYSASSLEEMKKLSVQNGDICIRQDENKSYIFSDGWVYLASPTDYAAKSGYAETAKTAENANKINNHRLVEMTAQEFETAVKDENTYYLVY